MPLRSGIFPERLHALPVRPLSPEPRAGPVERDSASRVCTLVLFFPLHGSVSDLADVVNEYVNAFTQTLDLPFNPSRYAHQARPAGGGACPPLSLWRSLGRPGGHSCIPNRVLMGCRDAGGALLEISEPFRRAWMMPQRGSTRSNNDTTQRGGTVPGVAAPTVPGVLLRYHCLARPQFPVLVRQRGRRGRHCSKHWQDFR